MDTDSDFEDDGKKHGSGGLKVKSKFSKGGNNVLPADKSDIGDHVLRIMEEFPLLSSWKDFKYWTGFIQGEVGRFYEKLKIFVCFLLSLIKGRRFIF